MIEIKSVLIVCVSLALAIVIGKALTINIRRALKDKVKNEHIELINKIVYYGLIAIVTVSSLQYVGVDMSGVLVAGGIVGIVIGFASKSAVGNFVSGLFLMV